MLKTKKLICLVENETKCSSGKYFEIDFWKKKNFDFEWNDILQLFDHFGEVYLAIDIWTKIPHLPNKHNDH